MTKGSCKILFENFPDVVSVDEVKEMLKIGKNTVYDLLKNKQIKAIQLGKKYIIPKKSIIDFLNSVQ